MSQMRAPESVDVVTGSIGGGGAVLWFTGLSGAGKSTVAAAVASRLRAQAFAVEVVDGDEIRGLLAETDFSASARAAHVRRTGYFASRLEYHGVIVLAALVSPDARSRQFVRTLCRRFIEIYVATPLATCERRDVKGLYARARRGELRDFTGIDAPYEPPANAELVLDTTSETIEQSARAVLDLLQQSGLVTGDARAR